MEDDGADEEEVKTPEKLKQSFLDDDGKDRAKFKPIYNYKPTHNFSKRGSNEDKKSNDSSKGDEM